MEIEFKYKFGKLSKAGYRHYSILYFAHGIDGFLINILGLSIVVKFNSWLEFFNKLFFQFFFIRLTKCQQKRIENYKIKSFDLMSDGSFSPQGVVGESKIYQWYSIQYWVLPLTGWKHDFIFLNKKPKFIRVSKEKLLVDKL